MTVVFVLHNILDLAVKYSAEHFDRMGADAFVALQSGYLRGAYAVLLDKSVLSNSFSSIVFHRLS